MKHIFKLFIVALALTGTLAALNHYDLLSKGYEIQSQPFGGAHYKKYTTTGSESVVQLPEKGLFSEVGHYEELYASWLRNQQDPEGFLQAQKNAQIECSTEGGPEYFKSLPYLVGILTLENPRLKYSAPCFKDNELSIEIVGKDIQLTHVAKQSTSLKCTDGYLYSSLVNYHVDVLVLGGKHTTTFKLSESELEHVKTTGIYIFRMCDKTINFIPDLIKTFDLFFGGLGLNPYLPIFGSKPTPKQIKANIDFIYKATGYQWRERPKEAHKVIVDIDESLFQSGDFLAITRLDGLDQIIEWGTGSHVGHCVMILKIKGETYVVESQAAWYWPRKDIQINPYKQWIKWADNAGFHVTWLPLKKEIAAKFDSDAAYKFFRTIEGVPYGYHNFLFGWIDTPHNSFPAVLAPEFLAAGFAIVEQVNPTAARSVFNMALNMRLGTQNLSVAEIAYEAAQRNITIPELMAIPEVDGWQYSDGVSYVCSALVAAMYKAGGLFGDNYVNAVEFTPRDVYDLTFFDPNPEVPENCKKLDPESPFCQIMGQYRMEFPTISTVEPYAHMNEKCQSEGPHYPRIPEGC